MPALINPGNDQFSVINFLPHQECTGYSLKVAAKSAAGRRNPCYLKAILHAPGVFFCVAALTHLKFMVWWLIVFFYFLRHIISIMVVQAGQLSGWPVSFRAGIPTPVWATTHERRNSGGSVTRYLKEVAIMATVPALTEVTPATDAVLQCYQSKILTGNTGNKKWCVTTRYLLIMLTGNRLNPFKSIMLHVLPVLHVQNKR